MDIKHLYPKTSYDINELKNYAYYDTDSVKATIEEINARTISQGSIKQLPYHIVDISTGKVIK